jgi:hypothetical protein
MFREDKNKLYENVFVSFSFDFYSELGRNKLAQHIGKYTKCDVKFSNTYQSKKIMNESIRICRNDFGGDKMSQVQTGFLPYYEAINTMYKIFDIIDNYGYTNSKCNAVTSIKLNEKILNLPKISQINTLKLINSIDECSLAEKWYKNRHEKSYLNSLLYIYPTDMKLMDENSNNFINFKNFKYPSSSNFNLYFENLKRDVVTVKYVQYKDYQKQKRTFYNYVNEMVSSVYGTLLNNNTYTNSEMSKIKRVMSLQKKIMESIWTYDDLKKNHKNIEVFVDLKNDKDIISTFYPNIRKKIFELMSYCAFNEGSINYDSFRSSLQIKDANIYNGHYISDLEFFYSRVNGVAENCKFYECEISNSKLNECELFYGNTIKKSKIINTKFHGIEINLFDSFVKNPDDMLIEANLVKTIIMGNMNFSSYIDSDSEILNK